MEVEVLDVPTSYTSSIWRQVDLYKYQYIIITTIDIVYNISDANLIMQLWYIVGNNIYYILNMPTDNMSLHMLKHKNAVY